MVEIINLLFGVGIVIFVFFTFSVFVSFKNRKFYYIQLMRRNSCIMHFLFYL